MISLFVFSFLVQQILMSPLFILIHAATGLIGVFSSSKRAIENYGEWIAHNVFRSGAVLKIHADSADSDSELLRSQ